MKLGERLDDIAFNLEGCLYDLEHQFKPNDGGVCAKTIRGALEALKLLEEEWEDLSRD